MRVWYKKERLFPHMHHLLVYAFIGFTGQKRNFCPNSIPILKELMFTTYLYLFFFHLYDLFFIYLTYFSFILGLFYYTLDEKQKKRLNEVLDQFWSYTK
jgi:hypothetical protein